MRLFLFSDRFPFERGDGPFVIPELEVLSKRFEVTLVSCASEKVVKNCVRTLDLPKGVQLLHVSTPTGIWPALTGLAAFASPQGREEVFRAWTSGESRLLRVASSCKAYGVARALMRQLHMHGVLDSPQESLYYTFWFNDTCLALALEKTNGLDLQIISRIHRYELYRESQLASWQPWQRFKRDACSKIVFLCDAALSYFVETFGEEVFDGQYVINGLGVSRSSKTPPKTSGKESTIVSCSNVIPLKRVHLIAQALAYLPSQKIKWVHFGDGPDLDHVKQLAENLGIEATFMGGTDNARVRQYYETNHVDAFVSASSSEGVPVSIQEALAAGVPIVAANVGGVAEQVDGNGILLPEDLTPEDLAVAIAAICALAENEWAALSARSQEIWAELYDVEKNKTELSKIIAAVLQSRANELRKTAD